VVIRKGIQDKPSMKDLSQSTLAVVGLGYVGLPLAVEFGKYFRTIGFDISEERIQELNNGIDSTLEVEPATLKSLDKLTYSCELSDIASANVFIITVPTPIDENNAPDLTSLKKASEAVGKILKKNDVVIYESTVFPGATEEVCIPIIENISGFKFNTDFFVGYSPERINPGDKVNTLTTITKITSGSNEETATFVDELYQVIITAGTHKASSIKVAEAAKVIENTQRDLNIAVINEFAKIFNRLHIDTEEVLDAAGTKWNFLKFKPGLVGGHCISVDPYYLTYKAKEVGYNPEVILAGRRINDGMGMYVVTQLVKALASRKITIDEARVLVMGFTFKGDCPDVRNTKIIDIVTELKDYSMSVDVYDSWANPEEVKHEYGVELIKELKLGTYDALILAVDHSETKKMGIDAVRALGKENHVVYDVKHVFGIHDSDLRL